jgi:hypothetical protein
MKQSFKFLSLITMLSIMVIPLCLAIGFLVKQQIIAHKMFEKLEQSAKITYQFSIQEISWIKEGKELLIKGKMFDVKHFEMKGNIIEITGIFDEEEDALQNQFSIFINPVKNTPTPLQTSLIKSIFAPVFFETNTKEITGIYSIAIKKNLFNYKENSVQKNYPINIPPPKSI